MKVEKHLGLSPMLMVELFNKLCPSTFLGRSAPEVTLLAKAAWADAGYCLDAPDVLPAGGVCKVELGPSLQEIVPALIVCGRFPG